MVKLVQISGKKLKQIGLSKEDYDKLRQEV